MGDCEELRRSLLGFLRQADAKALRESGAGWAYEIIRANCAELLPALFEAGVPLEITDSLQRTPLNWAASLGSEACLRRLLALGADPRAGACHSILMALGGGHDGCALALLEHIETPSKGEETQWMMEAIAHGCRATLAWFLDNGYPLNRIGPEQVGMLEWAARCADSAILQQLVEAGAEIDHPGLKGHTPLMAAIDMGRNANAHWLLDHGADPTRQTGAGSALSMLASSLAKDDPALLRRLQAGRSSKDVAIAIRAAAQSGQADNLRELLPQAGDINATDSYGDTALHKACRQGSAACVALLLAHGAEPNRRNQRGEAALAQLWPFARERSACVQALLQHGADPRVQRHSPPPSAFASELAAVQGEVEVVAALQAAALQQPVADDPVDWSAHRVAAELRAAMIARDATRLQQRLQQVTLTPERLVQSFLSDPCRVLFDAIQLDAKTLVIWMLDRGISVELADGDNNTPLNIAARYDRLAIAELLLARGADPQACTERGTPVIAFARSEAMRALLHSHGAQHT